MINALNLSACLASALTGAAAAGFLAMGHGLRLGWLRGLDAGWDDGFSDALDLTAMAKSIQDGSQMLPNPDPRVAGPSANSVGEIYCDNVVPLSDRSLANSLLHNVVPFLRGKL